MEKFKLTEGLFNAATANLKVGGREGGREAGGRVGGQAGRQAGREGRREGQREREGKSVFHVASSSADFLPSFPPPSPSLRGSVEVTFCLYQMLSSTQQASVKWTSDQ